MRWLDGMTDSMNMNLANSGEGQGSLACDSAWGHKELNMTARKTVALTIRSFVTKMMSLLFSTLSRFVAVFLPGSKCLLISWLQSPSAVVLESN